MGILKDFIELVKNLEPDVETVLEPLYGPSWSSDLDAEIVNVESAATNGVVDVLQVIKQTDQVSTNAWSTITNYSPGVPNEIIDADSFSFDHALGVATLKKIGRYKVTASARYRIIANNRVEPSLIVRRNSTNVIDTESSDYARNNSQRKPTVIIEPFYFETSSINETLEIRESKVGTTCRITRARLLIELVKEL